MTDETYYQKIKPFIVALYGVTIAVTSGLGIKYLSIATQTPILKTEVASLAIGSALGMIYVLAEAQNFKYREKLEEPD